MNVNELLDTIEDALEEGANVPLSGGKKDRGCGADPGLSGRDPRKPAR